MKTAPHIYRSASKGKIFTRNERVSLILRNKDLAAEIAARKEFVALAKNEINKDRAARELAAKCRAALIANPTVKKIQMKKDGTAYFQARVNGKLAGATYIN